MLSYEKIPPSQVARMEALIWAEFMSACIQRGHGSHPEATADYADSAMCEFRRRFVPPAPEAAQTGPCPPSGFCAAPPPDELLRQMSEAVGRQGRAYDHPGCPTARPQGQGVSHEAAPLPPRDIVLRLIGELEREATNCLHRLNAVRDLLTVKVNA